MSQETLFNLEDANPKPVLLGTFPAHIVKYEEGRHIKGSVPYNVTYKFADEVIELTGTNWQNKDEDNPQGMPGESADHMADREVRSVGIWFNPTPKPGESWRNRDYFKFLQAVNADLKTVEVDGKSNFILRPLNETEVLGRPVLVSVKLEQDKRVGMEDRFYPKAYGVQSWDDGERIDVAGDGEDTFSADVDLGSDDESDEDSLSVTED